MMLHYPRRETMVEAGPETLPEHLKRTNPKTTSLQPRPYTTFAQPLNHPILWHLTSK
jgi:hypothetical protein